MASRQGIIASTSNCAALAICCFAVYLVYASQGVGLGFISGILTTICVSPLFTFSEEFSWPLNENDRSEENSSSRFFYEALTYELGDMRDEEHSEFGRMVHRGIETWSECVEELLYLARVLRENQGLLILLIGGVSSMMMALVAGLDDVNVLKALFLSITCYGVTTLLVARSAQMIANQRVSQNGEPKLSSSDVSKIMKVIPEEDFVGNDELGNCGLHCIETMLHHRKTMVSSKVNKFTNSVQYSPAELAAKKQNLIVELQQRRNYNDSCCICLCPFVQGERIRILPRCRHEFHLNCIDQWAMTFAANRRRMHCNANRGRPTCPLCNTACLGEV